MGRPKGSKNKPKIEITAKPVVTPRVKEPKPAPLPSPPPTPPAPVKPAVKPAEKPEEPQPPAKVLKRKPVANNEEEESSGPSYLALSMDNFIFTEHMLERYANFLLSRMESFDSIRYVKDATLQGEKVTHFLIKKILRSVGFDTNKIDDLMQEVRNYRAKNKPEQLYVRLKKK
jgi:hypothetical protein